MKTRKKRRRASETRIEATPEIEARRKWLAGRALEAMTGHPLDLMLINDAINQDQHDAGFYYAYLYGRALRRPTVAHAALESLGGRAAILDEENEARNLRLFRQVQAAIGSRAHVEAVENVCVFQRIPRWMLPRAPSLRDVEEAGLLRDGLERVAKWWRGELARRGNGKAA
jgi:hypothetical protein